MEGAFRLEELEHVLKFVEESGSLSEYEFSDRAPLVQLAEICNGELDLGDFSPGSGCEVAFAPPLSFVHHYTFSI